MFPFMTFVLTAFASLLLVPTLIFLVEVVAGCFLSAKQLEKNPDQRSGRIAVLIPAHNEAEGLSATLDDVKQQLRATDRLIVVADNCTDETASVATSLGAEVAARNDLTKIGKGYALDWGIKYLALNPPDIVVIIDADCRIAAGTIARLATACEQLKRPVQSLNLMTASAGSAINHQVAEFAWRVKNWVRPLGLSALGLPCQLMGTGMAIPWNIIRTAKLSSGLIVEDLKLGLELASAGHYPQFCPSALVTSTFPNSIEGAKAQRQRWEQGQIGLILSKALPLIVGAIKRGNIKLLMLSLDLLVPPLSLLVIILTASILVDALAILIGFPPHALLLSTGCLGIVILAIMLAWFKHGRDILPATSLGEIPVYLAGKLRVYVGVLLGQRVSLWNRADRS
jgi:cellulose synthase/poly-beta-1,6-N-acetylglucosamine synthase-like glycosyltransferase